MNGGTGKSVSPFLYPLVRSRQGLLHILLHTRTRQRGGRPLFTCQIGFLHGTRWREEYLVFNPRMAYRMRKGNGGITIPLFMGIRPDSACSASQQNFCINSNLEAIGGSSAKKPPSHS